MSLYSSAVPTTLSPQTPSLSALCQRLATQESLSPLATGPSCARLTDDQNEPFFTGEWKTLQIRGEKKIHKAQRRLHKSGVIHFQKNSPDKRAQWSISVSPYAADLHLILQIMCSAGQRSTPSTIIRVCASPAVISTFNHQWKFFTFPAHTSSHLFRI